MRTVSATYANRHLSMLLQEVGNGEEVLVTSRGRPVARIVPADAADILSHQMTKDAAWEAIVSRTAAQPVLNLPRIKRDELYDP